MVLQHVCQAKKGLLITLDCTAKSDSLTYLTNLPVLNPFSLHSCEEMQDMLAGVAVPP